MIASEESLNDEESPEDVGDILVELIEFLASIEEHALNAELNKYSMDDGKGGRILY